MGVAVAGRHLRRHRVLVFCSALLLALAAGVRLSPYLPPLWRLLPLPSRQSRLLSPPSSCLAHLHRLSWTHHPSPSWSWAHSSSSAAAGCGFRRLSRSEASALLNGSWVLVAGDSQARLLVLALLRLLLDPVAASAVEPDLFRRHSDYHTSVPGLDIKIDFVWAPYESNLTHVLQEIRLAPRCPDVLLLGSGLWHMLHVTDPVQYRDALAAVARAAWALLSPVTAPNMFWLGLPALATPMLNTAEKRERMTETMEQAYDHGVEEGRILRRSGGPFVLLDVGLLTRGCGHQCTADGMHYDGAVYDAALHVMLNVMLIESQQRF